MNSFLLTTISLIALLSIASYASVIAKKFNFPYTIFLFVIGVMLMLVGEYVESVKMFLNLELSKDLVFFIFLPTLIFESAFDMPYKKILRDALPIFSLSVFSLLISSLVIASLFQFSLHFIGIDIPYLASLLFGVIISATDPVAVLSIFKDYGVPKRIMYLFEGESLFNDGTAVALFLIVIGIIDARTAFSVNDLGMGLISFTSMIAGGMLFGLFMGLLFSKLIQWVKDSWAELTLTLILAHTTFILAELISEHFVIFKLSAIIATTVAALTLGNYGRYKISKPVREMMHVTWGYFAFISNSLIFLLMGILIGGIDFQIHEMLFPIILAIGIVALARAISVFSVLTPLNNFLEVPISNMWQKLLAWGSLRGAIAITMVLLISPDLTIEGWALEMSVKEFISVLVISCIIFTLLIKATSLGRIIKKTGIAELTPSEEFTLHQIKDLIDKSMLTRLEKLQERQYIPDSVSDILIHKYEDDDRKELKEIERCKLKQSEFQLLLTKYTLGIERRTILDAFERREVDEFTLKRILSKIETQYMRLEAGQGQLRTSEEKSSSLYSWQQKVRNWLYHRNCKIEALKQQYVFYRSRAMITEQVLAELRKFKKQFYPGCASAFAAIIKQYEHWHDAANKKMYSIHDQHEDVICIEEARMLNNHLVYVEEKLLERLHSKHIMSGKTHALLQKSLREE